MGRIAITGGSGSIGRKVVAQALAMGRQVVNVDRVAVDMPGVCHVKADQADYDALVAAFDGCDGLIHLAAYDQGKSAFVLARAQG